MRLLLPVCLILVTLPLLAQTEDVSKEELKKWKDQAKEYKKEPLKLRDKIAGYERMTAELQASSERLKEENEDLLSDKSDLRAEVAGLKSQIATMEAALAEKDSMMQASQGMAMSEDLLFYVQIGAYEFFNMNDYFQGEKCMDVQLNDGLNKYVVGSFADVTKAESFRKDAVKLGIDDAWVVPIQNGGRIPMEDALNHLENSGALTPEQLQELRSLYLK